MFGGKFDFDFTLNNDKDIEDNKESIDDDYYEKDDDEITYEKDEEIDGELLGSINKDNLTFDHYEIAIFDFKKDINKVNVGRTERYIKLIVFPFDIHISLIVSKGIIPSVL